jgi:hypothetical protein
LLINGHFTVNIFLSYSQTAFQETPTSALAFYGFLVLYPAANTIYLSPFLYRKKGLFVLTNILKTFFLCIAMQIKSSSKISMGTEFTTILDFTVGIPLSVFYAFILAYLLIKFLKGFDLRTFNLNWLKLEAVCYTLWLSFDILGLVFKLEILTKF